MLIKNLLPDPNGRDVTAWTPFQAVSTYIDSRGLMVGRNTQNGESYLETKSMPATPGTTYVVAMTISAPGDNTTRSGGVLRLIWRNAAGKIVPGADPFVGGENLSARRAIGMVTAPNGIAQMNLRVISPATSGTAYIATRLLVMSRPDYDQITELGLDFIDKNTMPLLSGGGWLDRHRHAANTLWRLAA